MKLKSIVVITNYNNSFISLAVCNFVFASSFYFICRFESLLVWRTRAILVTLILLYRWVLRFISITTKDW